MADTRIGYPAVSKRYTTRWTPSPINLTYPHCTLDSSRTDKRIAFLSAKWVSARIIVDIRPFLIASPSIQRLERHQIAASRSHHTPPPTQPTIDHATRQGERSRCRGLTAVFRGKTGSPKGSSGSRVSLACLPCRSRHVRCDAKKPRCNRCCEENKECSYTKSRRGGLDRAALAARRSQIAALTAAKNGGHLSPAGSVDGTSSTPDVLTSSVDSQTSLDVLGDSLMGNQPLDPSLFTPPDDSWSTSSVVLPTSDLQSIDITKDAFIDTYYNCFHRYHPCVLPRRSFEQYLQNPTRQDELKPLVYLMRFVGSIYLSSHQPSLRPKCSQLEELVSSTLSHTPTTSMNFFMVQCHLIYSICLYWRGNVPKSRIHMGIARQLALDLGMHHREFAIDHGNGDSVLEESWRRTWWQVYIVDAFYSAIKRSADFPSYHIEATTDLPCEEEEYERGVRTWSYNIIYA